MMNGNTKRKRLFKILCLLCLMGGIISEVMAQPYWTNGDYNKALWMTTRFYGAQRSGDNNWTIAGHLPASVDPSLRGRAFRADYNTTDGVDLSGGWHDCGDHVKFGQTQFYAAYVLLKGYAEFPEGYDDKYSHNYAGYIAANNYTWEGTGHDPNCIPDVLDELKHETDFLIKCTPNASTFWYQVGQGGCPGDHCRWETAVKMQTNDVNNGGNTDNGTPGARRPTYKNPNDGAMASFAGATLALMARVYAPYDAAYAALCQTHALNAYNYARTRLGSTQGSGSFYVANRDSRDAFVCCCTELFYLTGNTAYRTEAYGHEAGVNFTGGWAFDYANNGELGLYCLAQMGNASAITRFNNRITGHYLAGGSRTGAGVYDAHGNWGRLRYNGNAAFLIALYSKLNNNTTPAVINAIHNDVDYIMGKNGSNRSYIVGFAPATGTFVTPQYPHHRNAFLRDDNPGNGDIITIPAKNRQLGALVGGQRNGTYTDDRNDYVNSEVCIDYNAGLVGALGFIKSRLNPVTGACQTCRTPDIGADRSTCSGSLFPLTLTDASTGTIPSGVTYTWKRVLPTPVVQPVGTAGANAKSRIIAASDCPSFPCKIVVVRDSTGGCSRTDTVTIEGTIPTPVLAGPINLCNPASVNLTPSNLATFPAGITWQWAVDYTGGTTYNTLTGETTSSLSNVRTAGRYRLTANLGSCTSNGNVVVTSSLPTPVDGCIGTGPGTVSLSIVNPGLNGTNYNWYTAAVGGTVIPGGTGVTSVTTPSISTTTTYYVEDMSAVNGNVGPAAMLGGNINQWGCTQDFRVVFTANSNFTLRALKVNAEWYNANGKQLDIEILNSANTVVATFTSDVVTTPGGGTGLLRFTFNSGNGYLINRTAWGSALQMRIRSNSCSEFNPRFNENANPPYPYCIPANCVSPLISITGAYNGSVNTNHYMYLYDWEVSTGSSCARIPVVARVGGCIAAPVELVSFHGEKATEGRTILNWVTASEINNDYFKVERSTDGETFTVIAQVKGMGNKSDITLYSYADEQAPSGKAYYRLTQVDYDGQYAQSGVISVSHELVSLEVQVAPNPFTNSTQVLVSSDESGKASIRLTDLSGITLYEGVINTNEKQDIGASVPAGVYLLHTTFNNTHKVNRIVKQ